MNRPATVEATQADQGAPFTREAIIGVLDKAPDGYKLLAKLVDDPYELLRDYNPDSLRLALQVLDGRSQPFGGICRLHHCQH